MSYFLTHRDLAMPQYEKEKEKWTEELIELEALLHDEQYHSLFKAEETAHFDSIIASARLRINCCGIERGADIRQHILTDLATLRTGIKSPIKKYEKKQADQIKRQLQKQIGPQRPMINTIPDRQSSGFSSLFCCFFCFKRNEDKTASERSSLIHSRDELNSIADYGSMQR
jgi:hypothetical protein